MKKSIVFSSLALLLGAISFNANANPDAGFVVPPVDKSEKMIITDVKVGTGAEAVVGKKLSVHYTGWVYSKKAKGHKGKKVDSSRDHNKPYGFVLGKDQVIKGWDQGLVGMKVGGQRNLIVPSYLAYGGHGAGEAVPPDTKLVFDVELLEVSEAQ